MEEMLNEGNESGKINFAAVNTSQEMNYLESIEDLLSVVATASRLDLKELGVLICILDLSLLDVTCTDRIRRCYDAVILYSHRRLNTAVRRNMLSVRKRQKEP